MKELDELLKKVEELSDFAHKIKLLTNLEPKEFLDQLTKYGLANEPQKVKVPAYVAEKMKRYKSAFWMLSSEYFDTSLEVDSDELANWIDQNSEKFFRAWLDGYEVEEEQLYVMPVPYIPFPAHYCVEDDHISFRQGNVQKFTQAELDRYFPDIKQFAVTVEEVEG